MPIGSLVNDTPTTVTPDASPTPYSSFDGPAPNDIYKVDDLLAIIQLALNIQQMTLGKYLRVGVVASLASVTSAANGDLYFVMGQGWYYYDSSISSFAAPWTYAATGVGAGGWIWGNYLNLLTGTASTSRLKPELLTKIGKFTTAHEVSFVINNATYQPVTTTVDATVLSATVTALADGDQIEINVGPFEVVAVESDAVFVRVTVVDGSNTYYYSQRVANYSAAIAHSENIHFNFVHTKSGSGGIDISVETKSGALGNSQVLTPASGALAWGPSGAYQWLSTKQLH